MKKIVKIALIALSAIVTQYNFGMQPKESSSQKFTPLTKAVHDNDLKQVQSLVDKGEKINEVDKYGWTPLVLSLFNNNPQIARFLIQKKADVNKPSQKGLTPLVAAIYYLTPNTEKKAIIALLIEAGAYLDKAAKIKNKSYSPIATAIIKKDLPLIEYLALQGADMPKEINDAKIRQYIKILSLFATSQEKPDLVVAAAIDNVSFDAFLPLAIKADIDNIMNNKIFSLKDIKPLILFKLYENIRLKNIPMKNIKHAFNRMNIDITKIKFKDSAPTFLYFLQKVLSKNYPIIPRADNACLKIKNFKMNLAY